MEISVSAAMWFAPFVVPICLYVAFSDMRAMKIPNYTVVALFVVFAVIGLVALPFDTYLWRYLHLIVVLVAGIALNAGGLMGAGDAKFMAVAAPFIHLGDLQLLMLLFAAVLLAAFGAHRAVRATRLRNLAPDWVSWTAKKFPMGLALGPALALYLVMGAFFGT